MKYELDENGYVKAVAWGCSTENGTTYTGTVPSGYTDLIDWSENAIINAYYIVSRNLTLDADRLAELEAKIEQETIDNAPVVHKDLDSINEEMDLKVRKTQYAEGIDLNDINGTAFHYVAAATNRPTSSNGYVFTQSMSDSYALQTFVPFNNTTTYKRVKTSGTWGAWTSDEKNYIMVRPNTNYSIVVNNATQTIPCTQVRVKIGDKLSTANNGILIGKDVSYIKLSFTFCLNSASTDNRSFYITKNGTIIRYLTNYFTASKQITLTVSDIYIDVTEGDVIAISCYGDAGGTFDNARSHLSVEVIQ